MACINRMGSVRHAGLHSISRKIWQWCEEKNIWLLASYITSLHNWQADGESRTRLSETEWALSPEAFEKIISYFGQPSIDLFASKDNFKCKDYVSWFPDPRYRRFHYRLVKVFLLCLPPLFPYFKGFTEGRYRQGERGAGCPFLACSAMVSPAA